MQRCFTGSLCPWVSHRHVFSESQVFVLSGLFLSQRMMDRLFIRVNCIEYQRLLRAQYVEFSFRIAFLKQVNGIVDSSLAEIDMAGIAPS